MHKKHITIILLLTLGFLILVFALLAQKERRETTPATYVQSDAAVRETAQAFGARIKDVSLLAPDTALKESIEKTYKPYVTSDLLQRWLQNPHTAPGRLTSSPWPDHIDIVNVTATDARTFLVQGNVVLMTSTEVAAGGNAGMTPFEMTLVDRGDGWRVASYTETAASSPSTAATGETTVKGTINQGTQAFGVTVTPRTVVEDSRCPINARCIQAGTLKVRTQLSVNTMATTTVVFTLGEPLVWNGYTITLTGTDPQKMTNGTQAERYSYIYTIKK